jgi:hypothetical protein
MKTLFKIYILAFFLLSNIVVFAQPTENEDGNLQDEDEPATYIGKQLIWLAIAGLLFVWYKLRQRRKAAGLTKSF